MRVISIVAVVAIGWSQQAQRTITVEEITDRVAKSETAVLTRMKALRPLVEVYIQNLAPDEQLGTVPTQDEYFLGQFVFKDGPKLLPIRSTRRGSKDQKARGHFVSARRIRRHERSGLAVARCAEIYVQVREAGVPR